MFKKYDLLVVQPILSSYRMPYFRKIALHWNTLFLSGEIGTSTGFKSSDTNKLHHIITKQYSLFNKIHYQTNVLTSIIRYYPKKLYIGADARNFTYWATLLLSFLMGIPVYSHGQGAYRKNKPTLIDKIQFRLKVALSKRYICYTELSRASLLALGCNKEKLYVAHNTLLNEYPVKPNEKKSVNGILFIGRIREGVGLKILLEVMKKLNAEKVICELHIIGDGYFRQDIEIYAKDIKGVFFYGKVFDDAEISIISQKCIIAVHPGDAGLSIVHYMSLSLPTIVHDRLYQHGPEASYIDNGKNGFLYSFGEVESLYSVILDAIQNKSTTKNIAINAFKTYESLCSPDLGDKLIEAMED